ncbi:MAG: hypothetical protein NDI88_08415 [Lysobacter sp.]|nr:hypothetical protein [Lysobacter sp.]
MDMIALIVIAAVFVAVVWHAIVPSFLRAACGATTTTLAVLYAFSALQMGGPFLPPLSGVIFILIVSAAISVVAGIPFAYGHRRSKDQGRAA